MVRHHMKFTLPGILLVLLTKDNLFSVIRLNFSFLAHLPLYTGYVYCQFYGLEAFLVVIFIAS